MKIISLQAVIDANAALKQAQLPFALHLCDRCGGQSVRVEYLDAASPAQQQTLVKIVREVLKPERLTPHFDEDFQNFTVE